MLYSKVTYAIYNDKELYKSGIIGVIHPRNLTNTAIKKFLKKYILKEKKEFKIDVIAKESISEEAAFQCYGNSLIHISLK